MLLLALLGLLMVSCSQPFRDAPIDLKTLAQPDPPPQVAPSVSSPPQTPPAAVSVPVSRSDVWRAWVPRQVQANGDVVEGHYLEVSPTAPPVEVLEPTKGMPRVPRSPLVKPAAVPGPSPYPPPGTPPPGFIKPQPQGMPMPQPGMRGE